MVFQSTDIDNSGRVVERRYLVNKIGNLKIEIYPNEHPPPHFHVISSDFRAAFSIEDCKLLEGNISSKDRKKVEYFHMGSKPQIETAWNKMRPGDCPVGLINHKCHT